MIKFTEQFTFHSLPFTMRYQFTVNLGIANGKRKIENEDAGGVV